MKGDQPSTPKATLSPTTLDIAWAAGIFEGEGSCSSSKTRTTSGSIRVGQKDVWLLERLQQLFGGSVKPWTNKNTQRSYWYWTISGERARGFAMTLYTFLSPRRQAQIRMHILK